MVQDVGNFFCCTTTILSTIVCIAYLEYEYMYKYKQRPIRYDVRTKVTEFAQFSEQTTLSYYFITYDGLIQ